VSWDILLQRFPQNVASPAEIPDDYKPPVIGSRAQVASSFRELFPTAITSDPGWIVIDRDDFSIEVSILDNEQCTGFMLYVHGDESAVQAVMQIAQHFEMRALDCSSGEFMDAMADPASGLQQWRAYRDKVLGENNDA
jgi:hypothetical protein